MSDTVSELFDPTYAGLTETVLYQVESNTKTLMKYLSITNTSTTPVQVTINTPVLGQASSLINQFIVKRVAGQSTLKVFEIVDLPLKSGMSLRATADTADAALIRAGGIEIV